jgi:hypothetical protein
MGLTNMNKNRPILITGKTGTGKSTKALTFVKEPLIFYANEIEVKDIFAIDIDSGIIIEDVHHKPNKDDILHILRNYRGQVVLTSINEKSVPKEIKDMCQIKRAGRTNHLANQILSIAPNSEEPVKSDMDVFSLCMEFLKSRDRDEVMHKLKFNAHSDTQILSWLSENMHPNRLIFVDGYVKRRWSSDYFWEMLAYSHEGGHVGRMNFPKRFNYSKIPYICRKLGVRDERVLRQLLKDEDFKNWAKSKLNNSECRMLKIGEKKRRKKTDPVRYDTGTLDKFM